MTFDPLSAGTQGETSGSLLNKDGKESQSVTVNIDLKQNKDIGSLLMTIAHEGSHAQDHLDYQAALIGAGDDADKIMSVVNGPLHINHAASETRAYGVSAVLAEFTVLGDKQPSLMDSGSAGGMTIRMNQTITETAITVGGQAIWNTSWSSIDKVDKLREKRRNAISAGLKADPRYSSKLKDPIE